MRKGPLLPQFKSEEEENAWWLTHGERLGREFLEQAIGTGALPALPPAKSAAKPVARSNGTTRATSIRLDRADVERARLLAARKGLRYQTYLKMLLHEALAREAGNKG